MMQLISWMMCLSSSYHWWIFYLMLPQYLCNCRWGHSKTYWRLLDMYSFAGCFEGSVDWLVFGVAGETLFTS
jgi:hypothetical protein